MSSVISNNGDVFGVKCIVVGDGFVGKTSLLLCYTQDKKPDEYQPTVFDDYTARVIAYTECGSLINVNLNLLDTAGQDDFYRLRQIVFQNAGIFLICYSVNNRDSFRNVSTKWIPEIRESNEKNSNAKLLLVACKTDLRLSNNGGNDDDDSVTSEEGQKVAEEIGVDGFIECSAMERHNVKEVFNLAIRIVMASQIHVSDANNSCSPCFDRCTIA